MNSFAELCQLYGCDKYSRHRYDPLYERILAPYRVMPRRVRLLEIGIETGASLRVWMNYLKPLAFVEPCQPTLYAIDIDPAACVAAPSGVKTYCGDQGVADFLRVVSDDSGGHFDIVIDDGGHGMIQQQTSFKVLWPEVVPGGVYVIEDLESSMTRRAQREAETTTLDVIFALVRGHMSRRAVKEPRPLITFCGEAVAIEKPK